MTDTYRSTQQITDYAKAILVDGATINAFEREGDKPSVKVTQNETEMIDAAVAKVNQASDAHETTAIITKTLADAEEAYAQLRDQLDVTIIRTENQRLVPGTIIVPAYLAKGLEFDAVIMWDANAEKYHAEDERQLVYTIASRAMHQLTVLADQKLSPLLSNIDESLYVKE
ncbi:Helicase IV [Weissella viridescens]|uniref:Helicase IV n=1 Tax=Weissella viridescens TaxID=1629 RepID=A0A380P2F9_WEIVI|nr:Helicase IV [Weissella viridescens]